jgi:hypothetical protein
MDHQAIAQLLGSYGEFIGAIAVVVTLAYLAVQLRQTAKINKALATDHAARSLAEMNADAIKSESLWQALGNAHNPKLDVESLSGDDRAKALLAARVMLQRFYAEFYLFKAGILEEAVWEGRRQGALGLIATPIGQQCWNDLKPGLPSEFVVGVEDGYRPGSKR